MISSESERIHHPTLINPLSKNIAVRDRGQNSSKVDQSRVAMELSESLVESNHLLGVRSRIVALLAINSFCEMEVSW